MTAPDARGRRPVEYLTDPVPGPDGGLEQAQTREALWAALSDLPLALRAALSRVAARIPGVELAGTVTDRAGRTGVAVAKATSHFGGKQRLVLIFVPAIPALLAGERVLLEQVDWLDARPPVVVGYTMYLDLEARIFRPCCDTQGLLRRCSGRYRLDAAMADVPVG